jgi:hypothetical protein
VRWTEDLAVSGRIDWPGRTGRVQAGLELDSARASGRLELSWLEGAAQAPVTATGILAGKTVAAQMAP